MVVSQDEMNGNTVHWAKNIDAKNIGTPLIHRVKQTVLSLKVFPPQMVDFQLL